MIVERIKNRFGSVLAFVLLVLFVMTLVTFAIASLSSRNIANVVGEYWEDRARFGAYSGVHRALTELAADSTFDPGGAMVNIPLDGDAQVQWSIQVSNNAADLTNGKWAPDKRTWIPPGCVWIHSVGTLRNLAASGVSSIAAVISPQRPVFDHAIFAARTIRMEDSRTYGYYPQDDGTGLAHVASNLISPNAIEILDSSIVDGDAISGVNPAGPGTAVVTGGGGTINGVAKAAEETKVITGFEPPLPAPFTFPPPGPPPPDSDSITWTDTTRTLTLRPGPYGTLRILDGQTVTLNEPGVYYFQGSIEMRGDYTGGLGYPPPMQAAMPPPNPPTLTVGPTVDEDNPVVVYFDGEMLLHKGAKINWDDAGVTPPNSTAASGGPSAPRLLQFYKTENGTPDPFDPNGPTVDIRESNQLSFTLAGSDAKLSMKDAEMYGALIIDEAELDSSVVNFDIRLRGVPLDGAGGFQILSMVTEDKGPAQDAAANSTTTAPAVTPNPPNPPVSTAPPVAPGPAPPPQAPPGAPGPPDPVVGWPPPPGGTAPAPPVP